MGKSAESISIIGGADGPTSVFLAGKSKQTLKQKMHNYLYQYRKKTAIKKIKANPHSMDEVIEYIKKETGFKEIRKNSDEYLEEYKQMRCSFILQYKPELLGEFAEIPKLENHSEESVKAFLEKNSQREKATEKVSAEEFDIDLHIFENKNEKADFRIIIETKYGYIGGDATGNKKDVRTFNKILKSIHLYYGVEQIDIDNKSRRYRDLVNELASR